MTGFLQKRKLNSFLLNTSVVGPTFYVVSNTATSLPIVRLYINNSGSYYFYGDSAASSSFTNLGRNNGLNNLYKINSDLSPSTEFNYNAVYYQNGGFKIGNVTTLIQDSNGFYIGLGGGTDYSAIPGLRYFVRLTSLGEIDYAFCDVAVRNGVTQNFNGSVSTINLQSDGKIIIGGTFTNYKSLGFNCFIRLNVDGSSDNSFNNNILTSLSGINIISSVAIQSDGKILVYYLVAATYRFKRLNIDGTEDSSFYINTSAFLHSSGNINFIYVMSNGQILIGGNSLRHITYGVVYLLRINLNGTEDTSFTNLVVRPSGVIAFDSGVTSTVEYLGKLYFAGNFSRWTTTPANGGLSYLISFNSDLTLNSGFNDVAVRSGTTALISVYDVTSGASYTQLSLNSSNKLVVVGKFLNYKSISNLNNCIFLNPIDGSLDINSSKKVVNYGTRLRKFSSLVRRVEYSSIDNSYIFAGNFTLYGGSQVSYVLKLNSDGTDSNSFNSNTVYLGSSRFNGNMNDVAVQSDGKVILGGAFINVSYFEIAPNNINNISYFLRLNSDGTPDQTFILNASVYVNISVQYVPRFNNSISKVFVQSNGQILVGGAFTNYVGSAGGTTTGLSRLIRLNANGTEDRVFNDVATRSGTTAKFSTSVLAIEQLSTGQFLFGGAFTNYGGTAGYSRLIILSSTGSIGASETTFITNAISSGGVAKFSNGSVLSIVKQTDGKILVGGSFTNYGAATGVDRLIRLNSNGTLDTAFINNAVVSGVTPKLISGQIDKIVLESDGKILLCGSFIYSFGGVIYNRFMRLNSDGTVDSSFSGNAATGSSFSTNTLDCLKLSNGNYMVGGNFSFYGGSSTQIFRYDKFDFFVILNSNGVIA